MHVANVIDVYASRDTPFALIFRTYPQLLPPCRQPLCLLLPLPLLCRVVHRWILPFFILSKGTDGVSVENGNRGEGPVAHRICCYVLRVSAVYTVYSYKGNRELMLWSIERTGRWREREGPILSASLSTRSILDTWPRLSSPVLLPPQLIRFFIRGQWHRHRVGLLQPLFPPPV